MLRHIVLFAALVFAARAVEAQTRLPEAVGQKSDAGPAPAAISRSISREANRLVAVEEFRFSLADTTGRSPSADTSWADVRDLEPGVEILLTVRGEPARRYIYFLSADALGLTVLNTTDPAVPLTAKNLLVDTAGDHPDYLVKAAKGETSPLQKNVLLGPEGLFVANKKVASLDQVVQTIAREDVAEVSEFTKRIAPHVGRGAIAGALIGAIWMTVAASSQDSREAGAWTLVGAMFGSGIGCGVGATVGAIAPKTPVVVYRAR